MSAKVHLDEETLHLHLAFIPVVHTTDKKGNAIDKIACSEFWKAKDNYIQLQNAFYSYITENIYLNKIINTFEKTIKKSINWVCKKFAVSEEDNLIRDFQQETNTFINPDK